MQRVFLFFLFLFIFAVMPTAMLAQSQLGTGSLSGTVLDSSGAAIAGASVTVTNIDKGIVRTLTTNLRNAARLIYRYGMPFDKPALITTDHSQSQYIESEVFTKPCELEMSHQPHKILKRLNPFDLECLLQLDALHTDAIDPLDP